MDIVEAMLSRAQRLAKEPVGVGDPGPAGGGARGSKRRGHAVLKAVLLGGVVALAAKPEVRNRLLDALFGPEEQFEYESVTEPVAAPITSKPPAQEPSSDGGEGAAPAGETSWYRSWDSPSGATSDAPAAAAAPAPMYERWSHSEGDQAPSRDGASAPVDDDGESAKPRREGRNGIHGTRGVKQERVEYAEHGAGHERIVDADHEEKHHSVESYRGNQDQAEEFDERLGMKNDAQTGHERTNDGERDSGQCRFHGAGQIHAKD